MDKISRGAIAALVAAIALMAPAAFADIKAFNTAVQKGDYKTAAAEARTIWPGWNKADPDTATVAREFGFISYAAGDYAAARDYGQFLKDQGASLAKPDDQPETSAVLLAASEYQLAANAGTRKQLFDALTARAAEPGFDNISYLAAESLLARDLADGDWKRAEESARVAGRLTATGGAAFESEQWKYRMYAAAAHYLRNSSRDAYQEIIGVHEGLVAAIDNAPSDAAAAKLAPIFWQARAWRSSMRSHIRSSYMQLNRRSQDEKQDLAVKHPSRPTVVPAETPENTPCPTKLDFKHPPKYPSSALFRGFVGTVIVKVDVDASGKPSNASTLAAIPQATFSDAVMKMIGEMTIKPDKGYDASGCSLERKDRFIEFAFSFR
jgi:TonB family protein